MRRSAIADPASSSAGTNLWKASLATRRSSESIPHHPLVGLNAEPSLECCSPLMQQHRKPVGREVPAGSRLTNEFGLSGRVHQIEYDRARRQSFEVDWLALRGGEPEWRGIHDAPCIATASLPRRTREPA